MYKHFSQEQYLPTKYCLKYPKTDQGIIINFYQRMIKWFGIGDFPKYHLSTNLWSHVAPCAHSCVGGDVDLVCFTVKPKKEGIGTYKVENFNLCLSRADFRLI